MPTAYIAEQIVDLPVRFLAGHILTEAEAEVANREYLKRLAARIRYRYDHGEITSETMQDIGTKMALDFEFSESDMAADEADDNDPVRIEGLKIARELIKAELATTGITDIPNLDIHAKALYEGNPAIRERAKQRCEIRWKTAREALGG